MIIGNMHQNLTFLHAADVAELGLVFVFHAGAGADLQTVLLTDGAGAALKHRRTLQRSDDMSTDTQRSLHRYHSTCAASFEH